MIFPIDDVKKWFLENQRWFPWRENPNPYQVWVSEMMLQQTVASVVIGYYERWMNRFPNLETLAKASIEEVIKIWEGLGYYARAKNLHQGAKFIVEHFEGKIPDDEVNLSKIPGIGPYTLGAMLSFAFHKKKAAIDGNVTRVIARFLAIDDYIDTLRVKKNITSYVENLLPDHESWIISEALIELGATVCKKKSHCLQCPLMVHCQSYRHGLQDSIPRKKNKVSMISLFRLVAVIENEGEILLRKAPDKKLMGHLYEFPYLEIHQAPQEEEDVLPLFEKEWGALQLEKKLSSEKHTFTRFQAHLFPYYFLSSEKIEKEKSLWIKKEKLSELPFSSGHKKILMKLL